MTVGFRLNMTHPEIEIFHWELEKPMSLCITKHDQEVSSQSFGGPVASGFPDALPYCARYLGAVINDRR